MNWSALLGQLVLSQLNNMYGYIALGFCIWIQFGLVQIFLPNPCHDRDNQSEIYVQIEGAPVSILRS